MCSKLLSGNVSSKLYEHVDDDPV